MNIAVPFLLLGILFSIGVPVFVALGVAGVVGFVLLKGTSVMMSQVSLIAFSSLFSFSMAAAPLFILTGFLAQESGVSEDSFSVARKWTSRLPGSLLSGSVIAAAFFSATTGSSIATAGAVGKMALPEMKRYGYNMPFSGALVAAGGTLGVLIPPSVTLVIYSSFTDAPLGNLLLGAFLPGIMAAFLLIAGVTVITRLRPRLAPPINEDYSWKERVYGLAKLWKIGLLLLVIIGGIYGGIFTATEAAAFSTVVALILLVLKKGKSSGRPFLKAFGEAVLTTSRVLIIMFGASLFSHYLLLAGLTPFLQDFVNNIDANRWIILAIILVMFIPLGMVLDSVSMMAIMLPIFYPIVIAIGFDGVWFGILTVLMVEIGLITPPIGMNVYVIHSIMPEVPLEQTFRHILFPCALFLIVIVLLCLFPQIILFVPNKMSP